MEECIHGTDPSWCAFCTPPAEDAPRTRTGESGFHGGRTKQDLLSELCRELEIDEQRVGTGSSLPSDVFRHVAQRFGLTDGSMPDVGRAVATAAGLAWGPDCDSTGSLSGGGSTVTIEGLSVMIDAVRHLK